MKYVLSAEVALFLIFATTAFVIWLRARTPDDAIDGSISIIFSAMTAVVIVLTLSAWWAWSAFA
jgi:hypothetical protein